MVGEVLRADTVPGMIEVPVLQEIKLHLPNTKGKSGGTISSATHVAVTEEDIFSILLCPRTQMGSRKSRDALEVMKKSINRVICLLLLCFQMIFSKLGDLNYGT